MEPEVYICQYSKKDRVIIYNPRCNPITLWDCQVFWGVIYICILGINEEFLRYSMNNKLYLSC